MANIEPRRFRILTLALLATATLPSALAAEEVEGRRIYVIDGDTIAVAGQKRHIRLLDIDAPETFKPRCERERALGLKAKARLAELLRGQRVVIDRDGIDRYGRALARLSVNGRQLGAILIREGLAVKWKTGRKAWDERFRHWCGGS